MGKSLGINQHLIQQYAVIVPHTMVRKLRDLLPAKLSLSKLRHYRWLMALNIAS